MKHCQEALEALTLAPFSRVLGWKVEAIEDLMNNVKLELSQKGNHLYVVLHFVCGRKPLQSSEKPQ